VEDSGKFPTKEILPSDGRVSLRLSRNRAPEDWGDQPDLEKAEFEHDAQGRLRRIPTDGNTVKKQILAEAGISTSAA
jgi:hypothetical protein